MADEWDLLLLLASGLMTGLFSWFVSSRVSKKYAFTELLEEFRERHGGYLDRTNLSVSGFRFESFQGLFYIDTSNPNAIRWLYRLETQDLYGVTLELVDSQVRWESPRCEDVPFDEFVRWVFSGDSVLAKESGLANSPSKTLAELAISAGALTIAWETRANLDEENTIGPGTLIRSSSETDLEMMARIIARAVGEKKLLDGARPLELA